MDISLEFLGWERKGDMVSSHGVGVTIPIDLQYDTQSSSRRRFKGDPHHSESA